MQKLLIIGGVAVGATAAARARRLNNNIEITILESGPDVSFANCGLPYYIGRDIKSRSKLILQSPESFKEQYNVNVHTNTEALEIDRELQTVKAVNRRTGENASYSYDRLILAQGGKPFIPGLEGADNSNVFSLWTLEDMDRIDSYISEKAPKTAVVVGGGFIGLEMVEALKKRGLEVSNIELSSHVMPMMEGEIAGFLQEELRDYGINLYTGRSVTAIRKNSVVLDNGEEVDADMVLLSVGVRPTLRLAEKAGLETGESGGLLVDEYLQTSDSSIFAGGDMAETTHRILGKKVRIPLAGPANRQGRIAATNALAESEDEKIAYKGAQGTSIVRVFEAAAGITGISLKQALDAGIDAGSIVVHKENHVTYYPGAEMVTVYLVYERQTGRILGAQTAGVNGADKRLDVLSTAVAAGMTVEDLGELDLSYSPPFGSANDPVNMAGFAAENRITGYSPALTASEIENYLRGRKTAVIDIRDYFTYQKGHLEGAVNIPEDKTAEAAAKLPEDASVLIIDETGKTAHRVVRKLLLNGFKNAVYISGGYISLQRYAAVSGFDYLPVPVKPVETKSVSGETKQAEEKEGGNNSSDSISSSGPLLVDVRTPEEYEMGAHPDAVNIPLDDLERSIEKLGAKNRELILYCASGARSAYGKRILEELGFTNVKNGGGIMQIMAS